MLAVFDLSLSLYPDKLTAFIHCIMDAIFGIAGMVVVGLAAISVLFIIYYIVSHIYGRQRERIDHLRYLYEQNHSHSASDSAIREYYEEHPEELKEAEDAMSKRKGNWQFG